MTISEAAQLVIQSSVLAKGGDLFLLDMGQPVRIKDLATQLINLSGLSVKDEKNPDGDIEIITTGLRPGEKLYEELLVDGDSQITTHPLIYKAKEKHLEPKKLWKNLEELKVALKNNDKEHTKKLILELVPYQNQKIS